ncbi:MAG: transposase [Bacteriovoracaceae bacterium]|nr:transposase [Bacteriovoracaceae bacterium]
MVNEVLSSKVLHADETPHKMLEGDEIYHWYLWGFFTTKGCYFEAHGTRSGDVAFKNLEKSAAEFLLTDGFAGYGKAVKDLEKRTVKNNRSTLQLPRISLFQRCQYNMGK